MSSFSSDPQSIEIASGEIISMQMNKDSSDKYVSEVHIGASDIRGLSVHSFIHANSAAPVAVKTTSGVVYGYSVSSINAAPVYLKFWNVASSPTVGTDAPFMRFEIPTPATAADGRQEKDFWLPGITFSNGIFVVLLDDLADAGTTKVEAANHMVNIFYA